MLDIFGVHGLLLAVVALIVIGPKDMPKAMRVLGYWVGRARGVARQFRAGFDEMVREAELAEMEKKWASENERIMREHGAGGEADVPVAADDVVAGESAPSPEAPAPADQPALPLEPPPPSSAHVGRAAALADMRANRAGGPPAEMPVKVEKPHVNAAPGNVDMPPADPAAS